MIRFGAKRMFLTLLTSRMFVLAAVPRDPSATRRAIFERNVLLIASLGRRFVSISTDLRRPASTRPTATGHPKTTARPKRLKCIRPLAAKAGKRRFRGQYAEPSFTLRQRRSASSSVVADL